MLEEIWVQDQSNHDVRVRRGLHYDALDKDIDSFAAIHNSTAAFNALCFMTRSLPHRFA